MTDLGPIGPFIGGEVQSGGGRSFTLFDPYRREEIGSAAGADQAQIEEAIARARAARAEMADMPRIRRAEILERAGTIVAAMGDGLASEISRQIGKAIKETRREVSRAGATLRAAASAAAEGGDRWLPADGGMGGEGLFALEIRVPVGVVGAITPFNAPLNLTVHKVAAAIAAGNPVVVKPSSRVPTPAIHLAEALVRAGLPAGAIAVLPGGADAVEAIAGHRDVAFVSLTGGIRAGEVVRRVAQGKRIALELGGNSATIIHQDADVERAASLLTWGAFGNAGQSCNSAQRVYVHSSVWASFVEQYTARVRGLRAGDPLDPLSDLGTLVTEGEAIRVETLVADACAAGAKVLTGGVRDGALYQPTVVTDVSEQDQLSCEEIFGPVVLLSPYDDLDEALARANATKFGLTGAVFTTSLAVAAKVARGLQVGVVNVNRSSNYRLDHLPYGGVKSSGVGREGPRFAMDEMTERRVILVDAGFR